MISKTAMIEKINVAKQNLALKKDIRCKYAYDTLTQCAEYIETLKTKKATKKTDSVKWSHRGVECIDYLHREFGDESTYIYCIMQIAKHLYLYEYTQEDNDMTTAEWYKKLATTIEAKHKNDPEWEIKK